METLLSDSKPFHEAIIILLENCFNKEKLIWLGELIEQITIPKDHQEILDLYISKADVLGVRGSGVQEKLKKELKAYEEAQKEKQKTAIATMPV